MSVVLFLKAPTQANASQAQLEAGNYRKRHIRFQGLEITIENPAGSVRQGVDRDGHKWRTKMVYAYGYIRGSLGVDGDHVDCYIGPDRTADTAYIVHQRKAGDWKTFDEDKVMLGFRSEKAAKEAYLKHYDDRRFLGPITAMPMDEFKRKVLSTRQRPRMLKAVFLKAETQSLKGIFPAVISQTKRRAMPVVCLDFDGVLHGYSSGWKGATVIPDPPVDGAKDAVNSLRERYRVVVNSARCKTDAGRKAVEKYLKDHGIKVDEVTEHKPPAIAYVDDLGVPFQGDWSAVIARVDELGGAV